MKVGINNLSKLKIGDELFIAYQQKLIERIQYLGITKECHCFGTPYNHSFYYVHINDTEQTHNRWGTDRLNLNNVFTTYEEAYEKQRELFCNLIEHYNSHQFKNNPIIYK